MYSFPVLHVPVLVSRMSRASYIQNRLAISCLFVSKMGSWKSRLFTFSKCIGQEIPVAIVVSLYLNICIYIFLRGFKTPDDAFGLPCSIAFGCSIRPILDLFHSWLCIFHLSRFFWEGLVFSFLQVSSES